MLRPPSNWRELAKSRDVVTEFLRDADTQGEYEPCALHLVRACMEVLIETRKMDISIRRIPRGSRLNDFRFLICPRVDDENLARWERLGKRFRHVHIIVPPWFREVARRCLPSPRYIDVLSITDYVQHREMFTAMDLNVSYVESMSLIFDRYERLADKTEARLCAEENGALERCEMCGQYIGVSGDNWDGLCPECADRVSNYLDENGLSDLDRDVAIQAIRSKRRSSRKT